MPLITATPHRITQCYTAGPSSVSNGIEMEEILTVQVQSTKTALSLRRPVTTHIPPVLFLVSIRAANRFAARWKFNVDFTLNFLCYIITLLLSVSLGFFFFKY